MKTLVLGAAIVDKIMNVNMLPKSGDDIVASKEITTVGGCAYNVANILNNLEVAHDLVVPVGCGMYGHTIEKDLLNNGYEIFIKDENTDNGYCLCLVENSGERTFITVQGTECEFKKEWLDKLDTNKYNKVYISGYELEGKSGAAIAEFLERNTHMEIYFAPGPRISYLDKDIMNRIYNLSPIIHLNDKEASEYTNKSDLHQVIEEIHERNNNSVFITLGPKGVLYKEKNNDPIIVEGYKAQVIDTIGAGDSHIAGIIGAKSMAYDNISVCKIANKIASKVVSTKGPKLENKINIEEI
ncbi:PfkB family carbohydrate kinase [Romboutsia sp. 1001216sp1]|uniref:PfkB family carbohydrate kinase n=1 Tax=unclassified Romboutsia TaxID=2626894 RepID=UPI00189C93F7|nr:MULTISPECIES: PfkB family carbohydrate kinase [unclassified Romboutsia]MDB8790972.1 PfkB family carbohydrate kinase [Romboutsia sp. 1001216sp1]MDB8802409.1 PfkB family carbohydrate kinase [Romboutsia sp. 1001216sp1]MDB8813806.1 PfkB family carbohydrate kinase [Romboutsia sp. 1001216sp1]